MRTKWLVTVLEDDDKPEGPRIRMYAADTRRAAYKVASQLTEESSPKVTRLILKPKAKLPEKSLGRVACEGFYKSRGSLARTDWSIQGIGIQESWEASAKAVEAAVLTQHRIKVAQ